MKLGDNQPCIEEANHMIRLKNSRLTMHIYLLVLEKFDIVEFKKNLRSCKDVYVLSSFVTHLSTKKQKMLFKI